ncbi:MAG: amidohydrolase family protein, partial [Sphingomonadales bacterium]
MTHELKTGGDRGYLRIATEEAFAVREQVDGYLRLVREGKADKGTTSLWGFYATSPSPRATFILDRLLDLGEQRIADMDATGIDKAVLAVTAPGMQVFEAEEAKAMARRANDTLAAAVERYPDRYIGLSTVATQDPAWAAEEIRRGQQELGFRGVQINSHTKGEYLDHPKFDPILRACAETDQLLYIHPQSPPDRMIDPFLEAGLDGAVFGFGVEVGLHLLRIITSGVFDRYPNLQIGVGHMGEALPFWLYRINYMHLAGVRSKRYEFLKPLKKTI